ncbi:MAG: tetratricopeptide repeat protein [Acidobacteriota bacterium]
MNRFIGIAFDTKFLLAAGLIAVTLLAYAPVRGHQFLIYDDDVYVTENPRIQQGISLENVVWAMTAFENTLWKPVTLISHMLDCQLFGLNPAAHLLMNLFFHTMNVILLFGILHQMTGALWRSAVVAALFALHPLNVESVAWVAERKNVLSTLFWLLTMWAYWWYVKHPTWWRYIGVVGGMVLGLMTKPMLVTLPCALLLMDYWPLQRLSDQWNQFRERLPGLLKEKLPLFALAAGASLLTLHAAESTVGLPSLEDHAFSSRVANAIVSHSLYLKRMVWPSDLAVFYPNPGNALGMGSVGLATLILGGISLWVWTRRRNYPYLVVGWLWFLGTLFPVNGLFQSSAQAMADRYAYVPLIGVFVMLVWGGHQLAQTLEIKKDWLGVAGLVLLIALMVSTRRQLNYWKDSITLFEHAVQSTDDNFVAHNNLGKALMDQGSINAAIENFSMVLELKPDSDRGLYNMGLALQALGKTEEAVHYFIRALQSNSTMPEAYNNLGSILIAQGRPEEAITLLQDAVRFDPLMEQAHSNLGVALMKIGELDRAMEHLVRALKIAPNQAETYINVGLVLNRQGKSSEAFHYFSQAADLDPGMATAHNHLGMILMSQTELEEVSEHDSRVTQTPENPGRTMEDRADEAIRHFARSLEINPEQMSANNNMGAALDLQGRSDEALQYYRSAIELAPHSALTHYNLGQTLLKLGHWDEAGQHFSETIKIQPDFADAHFSLGLASTNQGRIQEAIQSFQKALRLDPEHSEAQRYLAIATEAGKSR